MVVTSRRWLLLAIVVLLGAAYVALGPFMRVAQTPDERREAAYRANNRGVALLEQFAYDPAVQAFQEALTLDPDLRLAHINLAIALFYAGAVDEAVRQAAAARQRYPDALQPPYLVGLIARSRNDVMQATEAFERVLQLDADDVGAKVQLAQVYLQERRYAEAAKLTESALAVEPYNVTAAYNLGLALTRAGQRDAGQQVLERFQQLRESPYAITYSNTYLEQGRYAEAVASTGAETGLIDSATPDVSFTEDTVASGGLANTPARAVQAAPSPGALPSPLAGAIALADFDNDADLDLVALGGALRFLRNEAGKLIDATTAVGLDPAFGGTGVLAGDYNNDQRPDLLLVGRAGHRLYQQGEQGGFVDVSANAGLSALPPLGRAAAFVDLDHDGDLDLFFGGLVAAAGSAQGWDELRAGQRVPSRVMRNNGNGTFTDITADTKISQPGGALAVGPTDFDNRRDIDLLVVALGDRPRLFRNLRDGTFADVAVASGLPDGTAFIALAMADVNKDGYTDVFLGHQSGPAQWALSDGRGRFRITDAAAPTRGTWAAQIFDYDNDGLLDLFVAAGAGPRLFRNVGTQWVEVTDSALASMAERFRTVPLAAVAAADLDLDGDTDLVTMTETGELSVWRNGSSAGNRSLRVRLAGRVSNRSGIGSKVELRAGSLYQKIETSSATPAVGPADVVLGLGRRQAADVVRVLWPSGILQAETDLSQAGARGGLSILELDRKPSSCPYLFTWNGREFEFVTDFMGGGEMGSWLAPGVRNVPDPTEYVRVTDTQLRARNGRFEIRVTNELEEVLFVDHLSLLASTHPAGVMVFPEEGLRGRERPFRLYAVRDVRPPAGARDEHGRDVLVRIARMDRQYPDDFDRLPIRGYAREHALILDVPVDLPPAGAVLLLTGWTDYAFSSDNVAAHQAGLGLAPPVLQVKDASGRWHTIDADVGIPVGRPQTLVLDVARALSRGRQLRVVTNMRIYWDQILVGTAAVDVSNVKWLPRVAADLRWRGFSAEVTPDGREPFGYEYDRVLFTSPWKLMPGRYTREGDVEELLRSADDRFVISRPGDELSLSFDASALPPLPDGMRRTYFLYTVGYSKEMDLHSASPDRATPIPFRSMSAYPYATPERYPHEQDLDRFHTRVVPRSIGSLVE
ncbi:MAG: VCBS repeat-containing protein [Acidobacteria bacterium]|nr:VCBS repeat-containing protein [Acidobacteriota bacterium]